MTVPYADYTYFRNEYGGTSVSEEEFSHFARMASRMVDGMTFQRLHKMAAEDVPDAVRDAVCMAAERLAAYQREKDRGEQASALVLEQAGESGGIRSENNDGYSVTRFSASEITGSSGSASGQSMADVAKGIRAELRTLLANTGLMYLGYNRAMDEGGDFLCCMRTSQ